jgi:hypothetical protein
MPNWCSNIVVFKGAPEKLREVKKLFANLILLEKAENSGQLPEFIKEEEGYFFELWMIANVINYETRWSPNTDIIKQVADHFEVDFIHQYAEPMNGIHGKVYYTDGVLQINQ